MATSPDEYAHVISKQAIARACVALGFKNAQPAVLDALADVVRHYIQKLSESSAEIAEQSGRAQPGISDAIAALENMRPVCTKWTDLRDFAFDSATSSGSASSSAGSSMSADTAGADDQLLGAAEKTSGGGKSSWCQPFPHVVPPFPVRQKPKEQAILHDERTVRGPHIPRFLPAYPPAHTYRRRAQGSRKRLASEAVEDASSRKAKLDAVRSVAASLAKIEDVADASATSSSSS